MTRMYLRPIFGSTPATKSSAASSSFRNSRKLWQCERMIQPGDAAPDVAEELIVRMGVAELVRERDTLQPLGLKERTEDVLEHVHARAESLQNLFGGS